MRITEIGIGGFGKLCGFSYCPSRGFNVVFGENESGKTTLMMFIFAMLYGVGAKKDLREKYRPSNGTKMGGSLCFEHNGTAYRIERTFMATAAKDVTVVWNTAAGEKIALPAKTEPGEYILGITKETFENTLFIKHSGCPVGGKCDDIITRLNNIVSAGDESFSYGEVSQRLDKAAKKYNSKAAGAIIPGIEKAIAQKQAEMAETGERIAALQSEISRTDNAAESIKALEEEERDVRRSEQKVITAEKIRRLEAVFKSFEKCDEIRSEIADLKQKLTANGALLSAEKLKEKKELFSLTEYKRQQLCEERRQLAEQEDSLAKKTKIYREES